MRALAKVPLLLLLSLSQPVSSWSGTSTFKLKDLAGDYVCWGQSADADSSAASQAFINQATVASNGTGKINWSSATLIVPPSGSTFLTFSSNNGAVTSVFRHVLTDPARGAGYLILYDYPSPGQYFVSDFVAYSTREKVKVTDILHNGNSQNPTPISDSNFSSYVAGYSAAPSANIGITHCVRQSVKSD